MTVSNQIAREALMLAAAEMPIRCKFIQRGGGELGIWADVRQKTDDELSDQLCDLQKEAFNLRFQQASGHGEHSARS